MTLFAPPMSPALRRFAGVQCLLLLAGGAAFLWQADGAPLAHNALWFATLLACLWALGAAIQGRVDPWLALMVEAGALATASAALGLQAWHLLFKPLAMVFAIIYVALNTYKTGDRGLFSSYRLLLGALAASLAGDVFLMLPRDLFIPGVLSFLLAHLAYIALLRRGVPWFARRAALAATLALGAAMYALLWQAGLPAALRLPVAVYVLVIALMAAQAWARHALLGGGAALQVALGASCFMLSDALLAVDRFVAPLPWAPLWVLASYYAAQALIVGGLLRGWRRG